jgi:hypothetical protein
MKALTDLKTIITTRDQEIFRALAIARVLEGEQIKTVGRFASVRRTNRRLLKLVQAGFLRRWFVGTSGGGQKALYGLSAPAANLIGETTHGLISWKQDALITTSQFLAHQQAVNEIFLLARFGPLPTGVSCERWERPRLPLSVSVPLVPDGYFEIVQDNVVHPMFLEMDLGTESSRVWKRKVEFYLRFATGSVSDRFNPRRLRILILFPSARRLESIRKVIAKRTEKLFWLSTRDEVLHHGLWGPIWLRPVGDERQRLL